MWPQLCELRHGVQLIAGAAGPLLGTGSSPVFCALLLVAAGTACAGFASGGSRGALTRLLLLGFAFAEHAVRLGLAGGAATFAFRLGGSVAVAGSGRSLTGRAGAGAVGGTCGGVGVVVGLVGGGGGRLGLRRGALLATTRGRGWAGLAGSPLDLAVAAENWVANSRATSCCTMTEGVALAETTWASAAVLAVTALVELRSISLLTASAVRSVAAWETAPRACNTAMAVSRIREEVASTCAGAATASTPLGWVGAAAGP